MTIKEGLRLAGKVSVNLAIGILAAIVLVSILGVDLMAGVIVLIMGTILCIPAMNPEWAAKIRNIFVRQPDTFVFGFLTTIMASFLGLFYAAPVFSAFAVLISVAMFTLAIKSIGYRRYNILVAC